MRRRLLLERLTPLASARRCDLARYPLVPPRISAHAPPSDGGIFRLASCVEAGLPMSADPAVPPEAYEAAVNAADRWYDHEAAACEHQPASQLKPCGPCSSKGEVRAAVDAVWSLGVAEGRRLEREDHAPKHKAEIAEVVRELVALATDPDGPTAEWVDLVKSVNEGHYTPPEVG